MLVVSLFIVVPGLRIELWTSMAMFACRTFTHKRCRSKHKRSWWSSFRPGRNTKKAEEPKLSVVSRATSVERHEKTTRKPTSERKKTWKREEKRLLQCSDLAWKDSSIRFYSLPKHEFWARATIKAARSGQWIPPLRPDWKTCSQVVWLRCWGTCGRWEKDPLISLIPFSSDSPLKKTSWIGWDRMTWASRSINVTSLDESCLSKYSFIWFLSMAADIKITLYRLSCVETTANKRSINESRVWTSSMMM